MNEYGVLGEEEVALAFVLCSASRYTTSTGHAIPMGKTRTVFGKPIGEFQSISHKLAMVRTQLQAARHMLYHAVWLTSTGQSCSVESSMAKLFCAETCKMAALEGQTIMGAYGYVQEFDMERYVREALLMPIAGGSSAIQLNNIANWTARR